MSNIGTHYGPILVHPLTNIGRSTSLRKVAFRGRAGRSEKRSPTASLREGSRGADVRCMTLPRGLAAVCDDLDLYEAVLRQRLHSLSIFINLGDRMIPQLINK